MAKENIIHIHNGILFRHKKKEILPFTATWVKLEGLILSEINQEEKDMYCIISLICELSFLYQANTFFVHFPLIRLA